MAGDTSSRLHGFVRVWALTLSASLSFGCPGDSKSHGPATDAGPAVYEGDSGAANSGGSGGGSAHEAKCQRRTRILQVGRVDKVDLLFMIDNSNSMAGEQQSLKQQFPNFIKTLTTGSRFAGDPNPFPNAADLHVGIVSSDMGVPGVDLPPSCRSDGGDDGKLQSAPHGETCDAQYPSFLSFVSDPKLGPQTDPDRFANDLGCIATLGTGGCGFEQQLEAPFKALMPKLLTDNVGNVVENPYRFISTTEDGTWGRGDLPAAQGGNQGFLRNSNEQGQSIVAIVVVTDEEDCSVKSTEHLKPNSQLPDDSVIRNVDVNLRCFSFPEHLYDIGLRYYQGFRALRPGNEDRVVFAAIAGVPTDLVDSNALAAVDFDDEASRRAFYNKILVDERMQETPDPSTNPGSGQGTLKPSCSRSIAGESAVSTAYPPRRIVQLAELFGRNGTVQSICQDDFGPALAVVQGLISAHLRERCLPAPLARRANGTIACDVVWELPGSINGTPTPTSCSDLPYLSPVGSWSEPTNARGGKNCVVTQLAKTAGGVPTGEGWFYDDFSDEVARSCSAESQQRIAFSASAKPPAGVVVKLACETAVSTQAKAAAPATPQGAAIGSPCGAEAPPGVDCRTETHSLFCHQGIDACVQACTADNECPPGWTCDKRAETVAVTQGLAFCVDPRCGK